MKKILLLTILLTILALPAFSIGFGYHILEVRSEPEFANGTFPSSIKYQFNFPVPDFIGGNITELTFRLDNGLIYRSLDQDPVTGKWKSNFKRGFKLKRDAVQFEKSIKDELSEALDNFFLFNNKEDVEIISLQLKRHYPNYMDIEEKIYYPDDEELKKLLA